jgi:hypothetical protein
MTRVERNGFVRIERRDGGDLSGAGADAARSVAYELRMGEGPALPCRWAAFVSKQVVLELTVHGGVLTDAAAITVAQEALGRVHAVSAPAASS